MLNQQKGVLSTGQSCHTFDPFLPQTLQIEHLKKKKKNTENGTATFHISGEEEIKSRKEMGNFKNFGLEPCSAPRNPVAAHRKSWRTTES